MKSFTFNRTLMIVVVTVSALFIGYTPSPTRAQEQPPGRVTKDRPDEAKGSQIHIVYAIPSDGADQQLDVNGSIVNSVNSWNNWLADKSGGFRVRIDTFQGQPDITFVRLRNTEAQLGSSTTTGQPASISSPRPSMMRRRYVLARVSMPKS